MRLICPNCDAQYEVPDEVVPTAGRDVQCSNCGKTWFQHHPDHAPVEEDEVIAVNTPDPDEEISPPPPPPPPAGKNPPRKELDPSVADILRQEAEAEFEARRARQSETLESQPDLGLEPAEDPPSAPIAEDEDAEKRAEDARARMARMRGETEPTPEAAATAAAISSRRELLPDIDEINSTLRNDTAPSGVDADAREGLGAGGQHKQKRSFRRGFVSMVAVFVLLTAVYLYAPQIGERVPALEGPLTTYIAWVDQLRVGLDAQLKNVLSWLDTQALESGS